MSSSGSTKGTETSVKESGPMHAIGGTSPERMRQPASGSKVAVEASNGIDENTLKGILDDVPMTFPQKLMEILDNPDYSDVISWLPHGKGFVIYKKKRFSAEVLPQHFKQAKFTSFTRKLNRWGFQRIPRGPENGAYYHKNFQRGDLRSVMQMSCQKQGPLHAAAAKATLPSLMGPPLQMANMQFAEKNVVIEQQLHQLKQLQFQLQQYQELNRLQQLRCAAMTSSNNAASVAAANKPDSNTMYMEMLQAKAAGMIVPPFMGHGMFPGVRPALNSNPPPSMAVTQGADAATADAEGSKAGKGVKRASAA